MQSLYASSKQWTAHVLIFLIFGVAQVVAGVPSTNSIPPNLFLTDNGSLFFYKYSTGERMIHIKDIEDAKNSPESRPVEQDTQGHWGQVTNGLQLSLRFEKETFTNDEPVIATVLLRNATKSPVTFLRYHISSRPSPVDVLAFKDQKPFPVKGHSDEIEVISANQITIYPQTQCKYRVKLNDYYDLTGGGEFVFRAEYGRQGEISSQDVRIQIQ